MGRLGISREQLASWIKEAHAECKRKVPITYNPGKKKNKWSRSREAYIRCIREYMNRKIAEYLRSQGMNVGGAGG
jgi:2-polyprenyl-3-methyl-5-hydroxy-6-metoxy-1,4-benzoquinol methylase